MSIDLPEVVARYFAADKRADAEDIAACFTHDAVVIDERNRYAGRAAIREWMENTSRKFSYTVEPFALSEVDGRVVVSSHLAGNFPGSPVDVRYLFTIDGDQIAALEIAP